MTRRAAIPALALVVGVAAGGVSAQTPPPTARASFERGLAALEADRYAEAVLSLEASYRARPVPVVLFNLALAYRGVGRYRDAVDAFERYLADPATAGDTARAAAVQQEIRDLRAALASLDLALDPPSASIRVDGRPRVFPGDRLSLDPGAHVLEFTAEGRLPHREELSLDPGETARLSVRLDPAPAAYPSHLAMEDTAGAAPPDHAPGAPGHAVWGTGAWVGASVAVAAGLTAAGLWIDGSVQASRYDARCRTAPAAGDCRSAFDSTQSTLNDRAVAVNIAWGVAALGLLVVAVDVVSGLLADDSHPARSLAAGAGVGGGVGAGRGEVTVRW